MQFIGIDIAKRKYDVALIEGGKVRKTRVFENTAGGHKALLSWLSSNHVSAAESHFAMEATSQYYEAVATALHDKGYKVSVVNPLQIKAYGDSKMRRQKTDKADAKLIAEYCANEAPIAWQPPPKEVRELQRLLARLEAVQDMLVQERNRQHESQGIPLASVERIIASLEEEQRLLEKEIQDHIDGNPGLREQQDLLESIPGVGPRVSSYMIAWLRPERFDDVRQAVAFVGLSPEHHESGDSVRRKTKLSKLGHGRLRKILYFPAMSAMRCNAAAKAFSDRLKGSGKGGKVVIVAVMRKMIHWMMGVLRSGMAFDEKLALAKA